MLQAIWRRSVGEARRITGLEVGWGLMLEVWQVGEDLVFGSSSR